MLHAAGPCLGQTLAWQGCCTAATRAGIGPPALLVARPAVHILEVAQAGLAGWMLINPGVLCLTQPCLAYAMTWHHRLPHELPLRAASQEGLLFSFQGDGLAGLRHAASAASLRTHVHGINDRSSFSCRDILHIRQPIAMSSRMLFHCTWCYYAGCAHHLHGHVLARLFICIA
jgi:hypothetical protein